MVMVSMLTILECCTNKTQQQQQQKLHHPIFTVCWIFAWSGNKFSRIRCNECARARQAVLLPTWQITTTFIYIYYTLPIYVRLLLLCTAMLACCSYSSNYPMAKISVYNYTLCVCTTVYVPCTTTIITYFHCGVKISAQKFATMHSIY